eukprot:9241333-Alexandrium_andersonii.AAC.1
MAVVSASGPTASMANASPHSFSKTSGASRARDSGLARAGTQGRPTGHPTTAAAHTWPQWP